MEICNLELVKMIGGKPIEIKVGYESIYGEKKHLVADTKLPSKSMDALYQGLFGK